MRLLVLLLSVLLLPLISCENDEPDTFETDTSFQTRETVSRLDDEAGRIKFHCEDTAFMYLETESESSIMLLVDDSLKWAEFFGTTGFFDIENLIRDPCGHGFVEINEVLQDPELKVSISGELKALLTRDEFRLNDAKPFVIDTLIKLNNCVIDPVIIEEIFPFQETQWRVIDVTHETGTYRPACEYNNVRMIFENDTVPDDPDEAHLEFRIETGYNSCVYSYKNLGENEVSFKLHACTLGFISTTLDVVNFHNALTDVFGIDPDWETETPVNYEIQNNQLTLTNTKVGVEVRLFADPYQ